MTVPNQPLSLPDDDVEAFLVSLQGYRTNIAVELKEDASRLRELLDAVRERASREEREACASICDQVAAYEDINALEGCADTTAHRIRGRDTGTSGLEICQHVHDMGDRCADCGAWKITSDVWVYRPPASLREKSSERSP